MAKADIILIRDVAGDFTRPGQITHKEVQFRIDGQGPFSVLIPAEEYSAKRVMEDVQKKLKEWSEVVGKTLSG